MKRTLALIFAAMLSLAALTGCADTGLYGPAGNISTTDNGRVNGGGYATTPPANGARRTGRTRLPKYSQSIQSRKRFCNSFKVYLQISHDFCTIREHLRKFQ